MEISTTKRRARRAVNEINVVPYIDVMLVLLIIFMTTTPLLTEGVSVDLPQASAQIVDEDPDVEKFIVLVDSQGMLYANEDKTAIDEASLRAKAQAVLSQQPQTPFYVKGDGSVTYERVIRAMVVLQQAGVASVGLVTEPEPNTP